MLTYEQYQTQHKQSVKKQPSTVLFVEYSKGGSYQKSMREVVDRVCELVGFTMRVTESNKNLWSGQRCGRGECRPCLQGGDIVENCKRRNILYESECVPYNFGKGVLKTLKI